MALSPVLEQQRRQLILWAPVFYGTGIALYFGLRVEPTAGEIAALGAAGLAGLVLARGALTRVVVAAALALICLGITGAWLRTEALTHPVLERDFYGTVTGRVVEMGRTSSGNPRLTLDNVVLHGGPPVAQVRIAFVEGLPDLPLPGRRIMVTARLGGPSGPAEPGGFDFRRLAWFQQLSAVGYTDAPLFVLPDAPGAPVLRARMAVADGIRAELDEPAAGFAAAILTGDRSTVDGEVLDDLRASNLAHLLAISGLHMGLLAAFVYGTVRYGLALLPGVALRHPIKKWGAAVALIAGAGYLVLSGASVATQRAFIMTAVVLVAVMIDRPAFTLRAVALAAALILAVRPESLLEAGFQLSFAATAALVAVFEDLRGRAWWRDEDRGWVTRFRAPLALLITSSVAGLATAPFGAFHFNQVSQFGLLANLLAVPIMSMVIMPAGVVAGVLAPLGLEGPALAVMGFGIETVLGIAHWVAEMDGARRAIPAGPLAALPLIAGAMVWAILWRGPGRWLAALPLGLALFIWSDHERPDILIASNGRLVGAMTEEGRAVNRARGSSFVVRSWLENDGAPIEQELAADRWALLDRGDGWTRAEFGERQLQIVNARSRWPDTLPDCGAGTVLLLPSWQGDTPEGCALVLDRPRLSAAGPIALYFEEDRIRIDSEVLRARNRPWIRGD